MYKKMLYSLIINLLIISRLFCQADTVSEKKQIRSLSDLNTFWINRDYAICIGKGNAPCDCLKENEFVMITLDMQKKEIVLQSSIFYFGQETSLKTNFAFNNPERKEIKIDKVYPLSDSIVIILKDKLSLEYNSQILTFEKYLYKKNANEPSDPGLKIWRRLNLFNAQCLLYYNITYQTDSTDVLYTIDELKKLLSDDKISISCSDDFNYNSMRIETDSNKYFHLNFENDFVVIYEEKEGRSKGEKIDLSGLKKQILLKK